MSRNIFLLCMILSLQVSAQTTIEKQKIIYGVCTMASLNADPFGQWFNKNFDDYTPNSGILEQLRNQDLNNITIQVFFGTWCGDSKREVPRFMKLANEMGLAEKKITLIGVGGADSLVKQSPQHEEAGKGIFRVPTFIIYKNGKEINRINEYPVNSLEKDLLAILEGKTYEPNYRSFGTILRWTKDGTFADDNISASSLAGQIRPLVFTENELNSLGHLLLKQSKKMDALRVFQVNYYLFPESSPIISSLGEGYFENGDYKKAISNLERSLELVKKTTEIKPILEILYKAKEKENHM